MSVPLLSPLSVLASKGNGLRRSYLQGIKHGSYLGTLCALSWRVSKCLQRGRALSPEVFEEKQNHAASVLPGGVS